MAITMQRGASDGEVFGRAAYEIDPSRNDVWLVSTQTGERHAITNGVNNAAGYWCATWSPDGQKLAMLSTQPEGSEPRGGDNVRLYVWNRVTGRVSRMGAEIMLTQTRYGGGLSKLDLRGGADGGTIPHTCGQNENAPMLWFDSTRLLALTLPSGRVSGLIDQYSRSHRIDAEDAKRLRNGRLSTGHAVGSGDARTVQDAADSSAIIRTIDTSTGEASTIATVPTYPFRGALSLAVSPDGRRLALLATLGALQPLAHKAFPNASDDNWTVERRLGFIDLRPNSPVQWVPLVAQARYPPRIIRLVAR